MRDMLPYVLVVIALMNLWFLKVAIDRGFPEWMKGLFLGAVVGASGSWVFLAVRLMLGLP